MDKAENAWDGEYIKMIQNDDTIERFLVCTPFSTNSIYTYSGELTEDLFFKQLYVDSKPQKDKISLEKKIVRNVEYNTKNTIFILGNKGCGKTTFVYKVKRELCNKSKLSYMMLDFGGSNSTLECDSAKETIGRKIYKLLKKRILNKEVGFIKEFCSFYNRNEESIDTYWDKNKKIDQFFQLMSEIIKSNDDILVRFKKEIRQLLFEFEIYQLFLVLTLYNLYSQMKEYGEIRHMAIIMDNLDNMLSISEIRQFVIHYNNFVNAIGKLVTDIKESEGENYIYRYTHILVMREITKSHISTPHFLETCKLSAIEHDVTDIYPKKEIANRRIRYLLQLYGKIEKDPQELSELPIEIIAELKKQARGIQKIISDTYIHKTIFPLYNNDYRVAMLSLVKLCCTNEDLIAEYNQLMDCGIEGAKFGARGIIYRLILNNFKKKEYFKLIRIVDFKNREKSVSLSRLLLTYLNNMTSVDSTNNSPSVSLKELFKAFSGYPKHEIIECMWEMYNLILSEDWNHLITFSSSDKVSKEGLYEEKNRFNEGIPEEEDYKSYSMFRITCAGKIYLTNICTHYEFFACRIFSDQVNPIINPLFCRRNTEKEDDNFIYKKIVDAVYKEVELCCEYLSLGVEGQNGICSSLDSNYNYKGDNGLGQYHSERIIFSHISYLDTYRCYLLSSTEQLFKSEAELKAVSLDLLESIDKYIKLFSEKKARCSVHGKRVWELMEEKTKAAKRDPLNPKRTINLREDELKVCN